jgi:hypothetical protein
MTHLRFLHCMLLTALVITAGGPAAGATAADGESREPSIYRTTGPDGQPVFTDRPGAAPAERVELSPRNTFDPGDLPVTRTSSDPEDSGSSEDAPVYEVAIASPGDAETVRANGGNLTVTSSVEPELAAGDRLQLLLDGSPAGTSTNGVFDLQAMDRGEHRLQVQVIDERGRVQATSATHRIQLLRVSVLNR